MKVFKIRKLSSILFVVAMLVISTMTINAQTGAQANEKYTAENEGWLVNMEEAYSISKSTNKPILANFTGSDWCGWCKRLTASVFVHDEFKQWAKNNVVLLELDYPRKKSLPSEIIQQNQGLQQAFEIRGYPTIWVFDIDKDVKTNQFFIKKLGKTGYTGTVDEFTTNVEQMIALRS